jgi:hypothetical protein
VTDQPYQPPTAPKPKMSRGKKAALWIVGVLVALAVIGAIGDATGAGKKQDTASTAVASPTAAQVATPSVKPSPVPTVAVSHSASRSAAPTVPANGSSYPNAAAVLARLATAGLACTAPSQMAENAAVLFDPGATSLTICNSPGGTAQDTQVTVFDTATHLAAYEKTADANASSQAAGLLTGANWAMESTPAYATSAHGKLGGKLTIVSGASPLPSSSDAGSGSTAALKSAGPLGAYLSGSGDVYCDQATAYYEPDGQGGVTVQVYFDSSGILNINATSKNGSADTSQSYTEGTNGPAGHEFDLTGLASGNVNEIDFGVTSPLGGGDCQVQPLAK